MPANNQPLNPKTTSFEWGGPLGAAGTVTFLPIIVILLNVLCDADACSIGNIVYAGDIVKRNLEQVLPVLPTVIGLELLWLAGHCLFYLLPIGERKEGTLLRDGKTRLIYNINGLWAFVVCHLAMLWCWLADLVDFSFVERHFLAMAIGAGIISVVASILLYLLSFRGSNVLLATGGNTGNPIYDFFVGRELNPIFAGIDFKFVMELRPGLIGWSMINWAFVIRSIEMGTFTWSIFTVACFQCWYVTEALWFEAGNLTMMDIVHDGFGYMLMYGDIGWVPFTYCLQCKYLMYYPQEHDVLFLTLIVLLKIIGYIFFRGANNEKNNFRLDPKSPSVAHLKVMKTSAGKSLIISGFWGICRHPNYLGDWCMALSWSLLTGTGALIPFFYPIYFAILLIHRQLRDEDAMLRKYGKEDWKRYCEHVPYRLIPYVY